MAQFGIDRFATVSGYRIHYIELGEGHPLMLVPPSFATYRNWKKVAPALAEHFRVLAVDYLGTGESDKPKRGFLYAPPEQADVLAGLLDVLEIERAHLVGISYGGTIVLNFAGRHPPGRCSGFPPHPPQNRTCATNASGSSVTKGLRGLPTYTPLANG